MTKISHVNFIKAFAIFTAFAFSGCAMTSSGNFVGEAGALKYSTEEKEYRFVEAGISAGGVGDENYTIRSPHHETSLSGASLNFRAELISFNYSLKGQNGGFFLSVPVSVPMDVGIRPSFVQWIGPFYAGAGISFVGGFYPNLQDSDYEPKADDSWGRFDGFILYSLGGGFLFDVTEKVSLGGSITWERMAFNSGGSTYNSGIHFDILGSESHSEENFPAYSYRKRVTSLGIQALIHLKNPLGFYLEYAPGALFENDSVWKVKLGTVVFY